MEGGTYIGMFHDVRAEECTGLEALLTYAAAITWVISMHQGHVFDVALTRLVSFATVGTYSFWNTTLCAHVSNINISITNVRWQGEICFFHDSAVAHA